MKRKLCLFLLLRPAEMVNVHVDGNGLSALISLCKGQIPETNKHIKSNLKLQLWSCKQTRLSPICVHVFACTLIVGSVIQHEFHPND